jgi:hypothetical protein
VALPFSKEINTMAARGKAVHLSIRGLVQVLGRAQTWDEVLLRIGDYAEDRYWRDVIGQTTNQGHVRTLTLDRLLATCHQDPQRWQITDQNSREDDRHFYVDLDIRP